MSSELLKRNTRNKRNKLAIVMEKIIIHHIADSDAIAIVFCDDESCGNISANYVCKVDFYNAWGPVPWILPTKRVCEKLMSIAVPEKRCKGGGAETWHINLTFSHNPF